MAWYYIYAALLMYLLFQQASVQVWYSDPHNQILENVPLNCEEIIENGKETQKYASWDFNAEHVLQEFETNDDLCEVVSKYFLFEESPLSPEEFRFPLAYGLVVYQDLIQVILELSIFYQPQNVYCITIDDNASQSFKKVVMALPKCFKNVVSFIGERSDWGSFGIVENMLNCVDFLARSKKKWKYYQYLSGSDIPIRTNLEMVRVMKALNGSINTDVEQVERNRLNHLRKENQPLPLYKGSMSVALPRAAANYIVKNKKVKGLMEFLSKTWIPDESVWTTIAGNSKTLPVPGGFNATDILYLRHNKRNMGIDLHMVSYVGTSFIARYQVWWTQPGCRGMQRSVSCVFGVGDVSTILTRPELIAHKFYRSYQPAAMMCMIKEIRRRSHNPVPFDASSYKEMPTVELHNGKKLSELKHPDWVHISSFT